MKEKTKFILDYLSQQYPQPRSELNYGSVYELLVSVILSAQCTDKRVNIVTKELFALANTPDKMANLPINEIERIIHPCGLYKNKAQFLHDSSVDIMIKYGGKVPNNIEQLRTLAGVGRKTANVVYAFGFGGQAIPVDTHVFRVSNRLGLAHATNVLDTEKQLMKAIDQDLWRDSHHYLLLFGRYICKAISPQCGKCGLTSVCEYFQKINKK